MLFLNLKFSLFRYMSKPEKNVKRSAIKTPLKTFNSLYNLDFFLLRILRITDLFLKITLNYFLPIGSSNIKW